VGAFLKNIIFTDFALNFYLNILGLLSRTIQEQLTMGRIFLKT
jgi:hypothetical protein